MILTENELCIIQQALGLRSMTMINSTDVLRDPPAGLRETNRLRVKIIKEIGDRRRETKPKNICAYCRLKPMTHAPWCPTRR